MSGGTLVLQDDTNLSISSDSGLSPVQKGETKFTQDMILQNTRTVMQGLDQLKNEHNSILHRSV